MACQHGRFATSPMNPSLKMASEVFQAVIQDVCVPRFVLGVSTYTLVVSFAGLGFMAFYLAGKVHLFDNRGHAPKAWLSLAPLAGAALVAISRTMDYRHHWQDVLVGGALGLLVSYFAYRQYYPPLTSRRSHVPYAPRDKDAARAGPVLPTTRDEDDTPSVRYTDVHDESDGTDGGEELREVHPPRKDDPRREIEVPLHETQ